MRQRAVLSTVATTAALMLGLAAMTPVGAQNNPGRGGQGGYGRQGRPGGFGGPGAFFGFNMFRQMGSLTLDPARSYEAALLNRVDVRHELMLSGRQQEQLSDVLQKGQQEIAQKAASAFQDMRQQMRQGGQDPRGMSPEERQAYFQNMRQQMQTQMAAAIANQDKQLEAVLTPGQVNRLHQLDLQWRTAMALSVPDLADKVGLTDDQRAKVTAITQDFRTGQRQAMGSIWGGFRRNNPQGGANGTQNNNAQDSTNGAQGNNAQDNASQGNAPQVNPNNSPAFNDPQAMQARMTEAQKQTDKLRKTDSDKVYALLTPAQRQKWLNLEGKLFYFDPNSDQYNNQQ